MYQYTCNHVHVHVDVVTQNVQVGYLEGCFETPNCVNIVIALWCLGRVVKECTHIPIYKGTIVLVYAGE